MSVVKHLKGNASFEESTNDRVPVHADVNVHFSPYV